MENLREKIALVLVGGEKENELIDILREVKYVELRIDEFLRNYSKEQLVDWIKKIRKIGENQIIGTCRWYKEAGENFFYIPDKKRLEIYRKIIDYVDIVDVEIKNKICENVIEIAKSKNKRIILSYHNFKKTPDYKILKKIIKTGKRKSADFVKIATKISSPKNLFNLIKLTYEYSKKIKIITVPMGVDISERLILLTFGSQFTYISFSKKVAPSQPSYSELKNLTNLKLVLT
ncbi:MAG: type I 3-dehydroquinate dehydratase [Candidatus Omnitrophica bacterium]|nr:type I 3-dehydroquinate dehydratase [Candidatus Omnitrophota bacterium]